MSIGDFEDDNKRADGACDAHHPISYGVVDEEGYGAGDHRHHKENNEHFCEPTHTAVLLV